MVSVPTLITLKKTANRVQNQIDIDKLRKLYPEYEATRLACLGFVVGEDAELAQLRRDAARPFRENLIWLLEGDDRIRRRFYSALAEGRHQTVIIAHGNRRVLPFAHMGKDWVTRRTALRRLVLTAGLGSVPTGHSRCWLSLTAATCARKRAFRDGGYREGIHGKVYVSGLSVAVARHGQMVYQEAFGVAAEGEKLTPSHLFRIASISKPITSVTLFTIIEEEKLRLGDLIFGANGILRFDFGGSYRGAGGEAHARTSAHTHLRRMGQRPQRSDVLLDPTMETRDLIKWTIKNMPLLAEPGQEYAYSNFGYCISSRRWKKIFRPSLCRHCARRGARPVRGDRYAHR